MAQRIQPPGNKAENQTEDGTPILFEATIIRRNNGSYGNCGFIFVEWRSNFFTGCIIAWNIFIADKKKSHYVLIKGEANWHMIIRT